MVKSVISNQVSIFQDWLGSNIKHFNYPPYFDRYTSNCNSALFKFKGLTGKLTLSITDKNIDIIVE